MSQLHRLRRLLGVRAVQIIVGIGLAGWLLRIAAVLWYRPTCTTAAADCYTLAGDAHYHHHQADLISKGHWFINPNEYIVNGLIVDSAGDPPLYALYLAFWSRLGLDGVTDHRLVSTLAGFALIVSLGLLVRRLAGDLAGIIAAALAAVHPLMWINDMMLLSEGLYQPLIVAVLWAGYAWVDKPTAKRVAILGAAVSIAALTRAEALALFAFMVISLVWWLGGVDWREKLRQTVLCGLAGLAVLSPWLIYNNLRFEDPVTLSAVTGTVMMAGSCDEAWSGEAMGFWAVCFDSRELWDELEAELPGSTLRGESRVVYDESVLDSFNQKHALEYMSDNWERFGVVAAARMGRSLELFKPGHTLRSNYQVEGRWEEPSTFGLGFYYALVPLTVIGGVVLRRRGVRLTPLLSMWPTIMLASAITFGLTRYRVPIDIAMIAMSAAAVSWLIEHLRPDSPSSPVDAAADRAAEVA
ncbi:MAG: glycosyltransferase family 39 protein [Acidimicrobiaceae bacterium]|nr:glycosyltransferase family 39 protein [Acidimicrobiaceae bacterium]